jgi:hypothetical protein
MEAAALNTHPDCVYIYVAAELFANEISAPGGANINNTFVQCRR